MECNKDEAIRAKDIAMKKMTEKDIAGAKKFALKAQSLYADLEGLPQLLATLDVYASAEKKINGEIDWYGVLNVDPYSDDDTIRKQYRKLALTLHPDKNKLIGADGAFKILSEAWSLLSDKAKRSAYNMRRRDLYQKIPTGNSSVPAGRNGFHNFTNGSNLNTRDQKSAAHPKPTPAVPRPSKPNTFWTVCNRCKMQYEYLINYLNHTLLCPNCHEPFLAVETPPPPLNGRKSSTPWTTYQQRQNSSSHVTNRNSETPRMKQAAAPSAGGTGFSGFDSFNRANFQSDSISKSGGGGSAPASTSSAAQAVQPAYEKLKREREEARITGSTVLGGERRMKKRRMDENAMHGIGREMPNQMGMRHGVVGMGSVPASQKSSSETARINVPGSARSITTKELSQPEVRKMLIEKARTEIRKKLNEWSTAAARKNSCKEEKEREKGKQEATINGVKNGANKHRQLGVAENKVHAKKSSPAIAGVDSDSKGTETVAMNVPDPDFHDFDKDRTEKSFSGNQVWAAYDDDDGMPRYYAMIHGVVSRKPFKMRISWLNSKSNNELAPINWIGSGFPKTSGDFRIGKHEINNSLNSFSHMVKWAKGARGVIQIYPSKGDVWALYRNWSPDWNELTPDEVIHKYDMVEVLEDYTEELGVTVTPLVKVAGFRTVFHRHLDPKQVKTIPKEELFRFSHQVPSYFLTGQEAQNVPTGCRELDPASTPLELLQVLTEGKDEEMVKNAEKPKNDMLTDPKETPNEKGLMEDAVKFGAKMMMMNMKETEVKDMLEIAEGTLGRNMDGRGC
ncbi:uncharacterized protein LOC131160677 [Malania oleifera]|uniref:uncharacterized protein LOC131160677 n=1 Tax=Malania oleifera TaxID=397392 RepID=UPI0025AE62D9|nr:uncharacterized protein LOC131160677 [Malania oleifera]XP_057972518.1 uncharacterized protein LOC131160677 [Malania oleifera]